MTESTLLLSIVVKYINISYKVRGADKMAKAITTIFKKICNMVVIIYYIDVNINVLLFPPV